MYKVYINTVRILNQFKNAYFKIVMAIYNSYQVTLYYIHNYKSITINVLNKSYYSVVFKMGRSIISTNDNETQTKIITMKSWFTFNCNICILQLCLSYPDGISGGLVSVSLTFHLKAKVYINLSACLMRNGSAATPFSRPCWHLTALSSFFI